MKRERNGTKRLWRFLTRQGLAAGPLKSAKLVKMGPFGIFIRPGSETGLFHFCSRLSCYPGATLSFFLIFLKAVND
jgi:hypothetical protein